jgi:hypothetical protein
MNALDYHQQRLLGREGAALDAMARLLDEQGVKPEFGVRDLSGRPAVGVETHTFTNGGARIVGLLANPQLRIDELGPPEFKSNERFEKPRTVKLLLPGELYAYDMRRGKALGRVREIEAALDPFEPALYAFTPSEIPLLRITAPARLRRGEAARIGIDIAPATAETHVVHLEVLDPQGNRVPHYSGNALAPWGRTARLLPTAVNDAVGKWKIQVKDVMSGQERTAVVELQ